MAFVHKKFWEVLTIFDIILLFRIGKVIWTFFLNLLLPVKRKKMLHRSKNNPPQNIIFFFKLIKKEKRKSITFVNLIKLISCICSSRRLKMPWFCSCVAYRLKHLFYPVSIHQAMSEEKNQTDDWCRCKQMPWTVYWWKGGWQKCDLFLKLLTYLKKLNMLICC